jgi:hypothetical protein
MYWPWRTRGQKAQPHTQHPPHACEQLLVGWIVGARSLKGTRMGMGTMARAAGPQTTAMSHCLCGRTGSDNRMTRTTQGWQEDRTGTSPNDDNCCRFTTPLPAFCVGLGGFYFSIVTPPFRSWGWVILNLFGCPAPCICVAIFFV